MIDDCGLQFLAGTPDLELGFHFDRKHWGQGYATEAAGACLWWALGQRRERIVAVVDPAHAASQRVLAKIGMRPLGPQHLLGSTWLMYEASRRAAHNVTGH